MIAITTSNSTSVNAARFGLLTASSSTNVNPEIDRLEMVDLRRRIVYESPSLYETIATGAELFRCELIGAPSPDTSAMRCSYRGRTEVDCNEFRAE